uniref:Acetyl-CoA hydrolase n=1 Tax=Parastrongyloides trichosuri TaxID=131310 RepID=A0A0N4Z0Y2_PARTI
MRFLSKVVSTSLRGVNSIHTTACATQRSTAGGPAPIERSYPITGKYPKIVSASEAVDVIKSGDSVFVHGIACTPTPLLDALCEAAKSKNLKHITLHHLHLEGPTPWLKEDVRDKIRSNSLFTGHNLRKGVNEGLVDFNSTFLHEVPLLFRRGAIKLNVALLQVSPPDSHGFCSLGTSVDTARAATQHADIIIAMSNKNMPRTFGDGIIHQSHIDYLVEAHDFPIHLRSAPEIGEREQKIGKIIAEQLVDDGATLQMGIGGIPDAALGAMKNHKDLGIHTEMFSDGVLDLVESNAITNRFKVTQPGRMTVSFVYGSRKLYDFLNDNPYIHFGDVATVNDPSIIRKNPKVTAINSCVEVDLTGQIVSDSIGSRLISGFGGQVDFIRAAALSNDGLGRPIIALPSTTKNGQSKIVPFLQEGGGVVTTRAHAHYIVTEYGVAEVWGKNMRQRSYELIKIAHPSARESLEKAAFERFKVMPSND